MFFMIRPLTGGLSAISPFPLSPAVHSGSALVFLRLHDPVSGGWFLYAIQVDPANPTFLGDYPKFACGTLAGAQLKTPIS